MSKIPCARSEPRLLSALLALGRCSPDSLGSGSMRSRKTPGPFPTLCCLYKQKQSACMHVNMIRRLVANTLLVPCKPAPVASIDHTLFVICVQVQEYSPWNEIKPSIFSLGVHAAGTPYCRLDHYPRSFPLFPRQKPERTAGSAWYFHGYIYAVNGEIKGCSVICGSQALIIQL